MQMTTSTSSRQRVFLTAGWYHLAMLNFPIDRQVLEPHVPAGTELDDWQGRTYVSVVGFQFVDTRMLGIPIPFHRQFEEVNLRFYVRRRGPDGWRRGVVFLREIAPRALVALVARWFYNEKYVTMPMRHKVELPNGISEGLVQYEWWHRQRWQALMLRIHGALEAPGAGSLAAFITENYWGYSKQADGATVEYQVEHLPWRVWQVSSVRYDCEVATVYGKEFVPYLREPESCFVADGSPILVRRGHRLL